MQQVKVFQSRSLASLEANINSWSVETNRNILNTSITCDNDFYYCISTYSMT